MEAGKPVYLIAKKYNFAQESSIYRIAKKYRYDIVRHEQNKNIDFVNMKASGGGDEMSKMLTRELKNATFEYPKNWIELNADTACEATDIVICTDKERVGIFYTNCACMNLSHAEEKELIQIAVENGFSKNKTCLFGIIEEEYLGEYRSNVGNAIIRRKKSC